MKKTLPLILSLMLLVISATPAAIMVLAHEESFSSVTVTYTPLGLFTATYITDYQVYLDWTMPVDAVNATIRASYVNTPVDYNDGYLVYFGADTSTDDTAVNFYDYLGKVYYAIWFQDDDENWLPETYDDNVEGIAVIDLVEQITLFNTVYLPHFIVLAIVAFITIMAYWHRDRWLYVLSGGGFFAYLTVYLGSTGHNVYVGIIIGLIAAYQFIKAFIGG